MRIRERFNPHAPQGARRGEKVRGGKRQEFQRTRPLRGATIKSVPKSDTEGRFQPTRPLRGATIFAAKASVCSLVFQPTRPLRGATLDACVVVKADHISTHAPLAGRDDFRRQSVRLLLGISTHAPLAGRDPRRLRCG